MLISVAMATYNGARFLRDQLNSISSQTVQPAELVVSDDGSTDETISIVRSFATTVAFPVRIVERKERSGFADNFLNAAGSCHGELIAFCDQDDAWLPNKLEVALARLTLDKSLLAIHRLLISTETLDQIGIWDQGIYSDATFEALTLDPYITGWGNTMLFRRELLEVIPHRHRPLQPQSPERNLSHDTWIYVLAAALGRVSHIMEPLIRYRQHSDNAMGVSTSTFWQRLVTKASVPMQRFHEQKLFDERMMVLFGQCARAKPELFSKQALAAEKEYAERRELLAARIKVYEETSVLRRLRAFEAMRRAPRNPPVGAKSYVKDIVLGVTGAHALLQSLDR